MIRTISGLDGPFALPSTEAWRTFNASAGCLVALRSREFLIPTYPITLGNTGRICWSIAAPRTLFALICSGQAESVAKPASRTRAGARAGGQALCTAKKPASTRLTAILTHADFGCQIVSSCVTIRTNWTGNTWHNTISRTDILLRIVGK